MSPAFSFGLVRIDTKEISAFSAASNFPETKSVSFVSCVRPELTKTWRHTGAIQWAAAFRASTRANISASPD
jgi:hypothetical protein